MALDSAEVGSAELGGAWGRCLLCGCSIEACGTRKLRIGLLLFGANRLKDAGETRTRRLRLVLLRGNAWVVSAVDVFLLPLALLLLVDLLLIETRLLLRQRLLIDMVLLLLRRRCLLITRVMLRLAAYVGSGG